MLCISIHLSCPPTPQNTHNFIDSVKTWIWNGVYKQHQILYQTSVWAPNFQLQDEAPPQVSSLLRLEQVLFIRNVHLHAPLVLTGFLVPDDERPSENIMLPPLRFTAFGRSIKFIELSSWLLRALLRDPAVAIGWCWVLNSQLLISSPTTSHSKDDVLRWETRCVMSISTGLLVYTGW